MTQSELQKLLRATDAAAVLVSPRILERVIRDDLNLPNMHWNVPHYKSYVCDRQLLFRHAEQADLDLESYELLPDTVILLVRPDAEELSNLENKRLLLKYWRRLFHGQVHRQMGERFRQGLLDQQALRQRLEVIGGTEFEEIREVLVEDRWLSDQATDQETYIEFAAVYLEMRQFAANLLPNYFPGIRDFGQIESLFKQDIDAQELFERSRLTGAAEPVHVIDWRVDDTQELYWKLVRQAQHAAMEDNLVAAAILRMRASRVAQAAHTLPTRLEAEKDIAQLGKRLSQALSLSEAETSDWIRHLTLLLDKADQGNRPMEARVLEELLKVCQDHEKEIYTLDLVEYFLSGGKRPIKRPLPSQRLVRIAQHLRSALQKLSTVRLSDTDRNHLTRLIQQALHKTEEGLRARFRPVLVTAMEDVGLRADGPLQKASLEKMVAELLDRIGTYGYLTFAELRDTISRNQLKLPDLTDPEDFIRGDALIRLDRRLGSLLDGVYRPSDFYVRWLERFTSLQFGTAWGRLVTLYVTGPLLLAWLLLFILGFLVEEVHKYFWDEPILKTVATVLMGPALLPQAVEEQSEPDPSLWWHFALLVPMTLFLLALLRSETFQSRCLAAFVSFWRAFRFILWDVPRAIIPTTMIHRVLSSWIFQLIWWYVLKPLTLCALLYPVWPAPFRRWYGAAALFMLICFMLNSRVGRATSEMIRDSFLHLGILIRAGLLPGLVRLIIQVFKQVVEFVEYILFKVDEWLRFRSGDSRLSLIIRTILGALWYPFAFLTRFYMVVLIEPGLNPIKFAISSVAAKIVYPLVLGLGVSSSLIELLAPFLGTNLATLIVVPTIWLSPDAFGFLFWEFKENWRLYRANRGKSPRPAVVGSHGETIRGLLQPGFHSGTIPRLYARLRAAERRAMVSRNWNAPRAYRQEVQEVAHEVEKFFARDMLLILKQSRVWQGHPISVGPVYLSTNRIRVELEHADHPTTPVELEIEHHHGRLLATVASLGWLPTLSADHRAPFQACLAYLYKRADIDLVREQILNQWSGPVVTMQISREELRIWSASDQPPARIPLVEDLAQLGRPRDSDRFLFSRYSLTWEEWDAVWLQDQQGLTNVDLLPWREQLLRLPPQPSASVSLAPAHPTTESNGDLGVEQQAPSSTQDA